MNKKITVIGIIILILGTTGIALANMNALPFKKQSNLVDRTNLIGDQMLSMDVISNLDQIGPMYSAVNVYFQIITQDNSNPNFIIKLGINFPDQEYLGCPASSTTPCAIPGKEISIDQPSGNTHSLSSTEAPILSIPLVMEGLKLDSSIKHDYWLMITTTSKQSYEVKYQFEFSWQITVPIGVIMGIIGLIITVIGFTKSSSGSKYKPLPTRPAFEPSIGGGGTSSKKSKSSKKGKKSKKGKASSSKHPSAHTCRKCSGVLPKNAQYCPHCYTRQ